MAKLQILLTNDDGIRSPGLWAAAAALSPLGFVTVAAPREQSSGMGRSLPGNSDGIIQREVVMVNGQEWIVHAVGGTPAQAVQHALLEILPQQPDLVVSGINYGENLATGITISGTVGAAMEAAAVGIPAIAISLETDKEHHLSYSTEVNFSTAAYFTEYFGRLILEHGLPPGVDLLKIDIPANATPATPWEWTRLSKQRYYHPTAPKRVSWNVPGTVGYEMSVDWTQEPHDTDIFVLLKKRHISVTPLTLDMTAPFTASALNTLYPQNGKG
ncbi:MAG: 5'/3'-nucleotidase SurE [Anaerolineae bacterium]|nr:MAG: 5'/3'-nucleotidase SurE [Anaerolineae bacterium]